MRPASRCCCAYMLERLNIQHVVRWEHHSLVRGERLRVAVRFYALQIQMQCCLQQASHVLYFEIVESNAVYGQEVRAALASQEASLRQRDALLAEKSADIAALQVPESAPIS